jgi:hypothetical protein
MVCKFYISSFVALNKLIKKCLGWDDVNNAPPRQHVHCKILRGVGMHTHTSIIEFCLKDQKEGHFQFCHRNANAKEMQDGVDEFVQYRTCFNKNKVCLKYNNIMERATIFCKYKMKNKIKIGVVLVGVLLEMLKFKQFYPTPSWVVPFKNSSMEYLKLQSLWKCMMMSPSLELDDVARIFYEHTNPSLS